MYVIVFIIFQWKFVLMEPIIYLCNTFQWKIINIKKYALHFIDSINYYVWDDNKLCRAKNKSKNK